MSKDGGVWRNGNTWWNMVKSQEVRCKKQEERVRGKESDGRQEARKMKHRGKSEVRESKVIYDPFFF